ncbi:MAG: serine hydrolase [Planctomycetota bacterium]|nr:serine hydrolase [Planctomycetota bacterium]
MHKRILLVIFVLTLQTHLLAGVWPGDTWQTASPESQGVDSDKLNQAMSYLASKCGSAGTEQAVVIRNGYMIWKGSDIDNSHNVWSASKSFTSTVQGLLIDDGKCALDTYAKDYVSSLSSEYSGVKLRHFATMTSGYDGANHSGEDTCQSKTPFEPTSRLFSPGSEFKYCDDAMNEFANVLTRIAGEDIESFFKDRIADPIGMNDAKWDWGDWGTIDGMVVNGGAGNKGKGIHISARELARFGLLFLNRGNWNGRQLISSSWVDQATAIQVPASLPGSDGHYGYNWWRLSGTPVPTYKASGYNNNQCIVINDWNMVIVRLGKDGSIDNSIYATFLGMIEETLDPGPLPGQIIVDPDHPEWLKYNDGGPFFMCGPGDPEDFLYRGSRNSDGTRSGDQMTLINKVKGTGANCFYVQAVRSHGGDGDSTHNPFVGSNPLNGLDQDILDQWESWFTEMDNNGIVIYFFLYDDGAGIWKTGDSVGAEERTFIQGLVHKFKHHKHLIWCVAEEYSEKYSRARVSNIAAEIRSADKYNHVIAVHQHSGTSFSEFANDLNIDQFAMQIGASRASGLHSDCVTAWNSASGRYNVNMSEGTNHISGGSTEIRKKSWASAMGGAYVMIYEMFIDDTPTSDLQDCGRLVSFFESTDFDTMAPHDVLKNGNTDYVLANPGHSYIAYASGPTTTIGLRNMTSGTYSFKWFDCKDGDTVEQNNVSVSSGDQKWNKPSGLGDEIAVYISRVTASSR